MDSASTLAYIDQASFLGLRALGRGPLVQFTWIYEHPVDLDGLRRFHRNLSRGLLGRRIERSALPFGRHHWVTWASPDQPDIADTEWPRHDVASWVDAQLSVPVDPETGPPWRLAVQPLTGGAAAVTLIASHTLCDGLACSLAVAEAARGDARDLRYPPPNVRPRRRAVLHDIRETLRAVPEVGRAVAASIRLARKNSADFASSAARSAPAESLHGADPVIVPTVAVFIDDAEWDSQAESLGGTSNSLFAGIATRLGQLLGRVDPQGRVKLSFPVSERTPEDTRGNALTGMMLTVDPNGVTESLAAVRTEIKRNLAALAETRNDLFATLPLTPLVPRRLAGKLEGMALGSDLPVGTSNLGALDPAVNRPDGTDADYFWARQMESRITADVLDRLGGTLFLASGRLPGQVFLTVSAWQPRAATTKGALTDLVVQAIGDFGLTGHIE